MRISRERLSILVSASFHILSSLSNRVRNARLIQLELRLQYGNVYVKIKFSIGSRCMKVGLRSGIDPGVSLHLV